MPGPFYKPSNPINQLDQKNETMKTWYLLYDGTSPDGMGRGEYVGRTTDRMEALKHWRKIKDNPYSTGSVKIITDETIQDALFHPDFKLK